MELISAPSEIEPGSRKQFISSISNSTYLLFYFRILYRQFNFKIASKTTFISCYLVENG